MMDSNWTHGGQKKVAVKAQNLETLHQLQKAAEDLGLVTYLVYDAGHTQVEPNTATVLAIGPGPSDVISQITSHLKLL